jgi:hypothetical protein
MNLILFHAITIKRLVSGTEQKNSTSLFLPWMSQKATKGLTGSPPEIDCNQTAMGLPPVTSAVFLIAKLFWYSLVVSEEHLRRLY